MGICGATDSPFFKVLSLGKICRIKSPSLQTWATVYTHLEDNAGKALYASASPSP